MIVISEEHYCEINDKLNEIFVKYNISSKKFKWNKFNSMDKVNALEEFLEHLFKLMFDNLVFIHTIIWDVQDSRHDIVGRDDNKNLSLMYYKLIKNFAEDKLKNGDVLTIHPERYKKHSLNPILSLPVRHLSSFLSQKVMLQTALLLMPKLCYYL